MSTHRLRTDALRQQLASRHIDAALVMSKPNRRYLTGFTGSAGAVIVEATGARLLVDFRYIEQATAQSPDYKVTLFEGPLFDRIRASVDGAVRTLAVEADHLAVGQFRELQEKLQPIELVPVSGLVEQLRMVKDAAEVEKLAAAEALADEAFRRLLPLVRPGRSEVEVALDLELMLRKLGAEAIGFDTIVASGPRSSLPHGVASRRALEEGDLVTFDFGCVLDGYHSDTTRTVALGSASAAQREVYDLVLRAQLAALETIRPGLLGKEVDAVARGMIQAAGHGEHFGHGLGHGVGLEIHEGPRLNQQGEVRLEPGHVVTVEPGVYIPGWGGVRIEDMVVVTAEGHRNLTASPKELIVL